MDLGQRSLAPAAQVANRRGIAPLRALPARTLNAVDEMNIRPAQGDEAEALSALALKAKAYWGYPVDAIELWRRDLTVSTHTIASRPTFLAVLADEIVGFYSLSPSHHSWALDHLWVLPQFMDRGIGRALMEHVIEAAARCGAYVVTRAADPN